MKVDLEKEKAKLLDTHAKNRKALVERHADTLVAHNADPYTHVIRGNINQWEEMRQSYADGFQNMLHYQCDDLEPPVIQVSQDASMAWMITRRINLCVITAP